MTGPIVNAVVVVVCALAGTFIIRGIPSRIEDLIKKAIGLSIIFVGIKGALENEHILLLIISMVAGAIIGELINIDKWMNKLGLWAERKLGMDKNKTGKSAVEGIQAGEKQPEAGGKAGHSFSKGFVSASIIFCTGSMAIVGSMQSGLQGNHEILFAKTILDGAVSLVFGASFGIGVAFAAIPVLLYEGGIVLASLAIRDYLRPEIIREMSAVGSLIIAAIGFNFLGVKEIKVANLIPAIFIPWLWLALASGF
ncbi:MAG: DUF554 domain-containing protein [Treponema sp.]|jgi:uncharacterized membrane protein YqgA involved in biofilm formation|nr:DUF554 domain-containing protein [Treponema sp.]